MYDVSAQIAGSYIFHFISGELEIVINYYSLGLQLQTSARKNLRGQHPPRTEMKSPEKVHSGGLIGVPVTLWTKVYFFHPTWKGL